MGKKKRRLGLRSAQAKDLRTPKYASRVVPNKRRKKREAEAAKEIDPNG